MSSVFTCGLVEISHAIVFKKKSILLLFISTFLLILTSQLQAQSYPGGVSTALSRWYKADYNASATAWQDASANAKNTTSKTGTVVFNSTGANYNPYVYFNGGYFSAPAAYQGINTDNTKIFSVIIPVSGSNNTSWGQLSTNGYYIAVFNPNADGSIYFDAPWSYRVNTSYSTAGGVYGVPVLFRDSKYGGSDYIHMSGKQIATAGTGTYTGNFTGSTTDFTIGAYATSLTSNNNLAELILYENASAMTATQVQQIESYLAMKYGISLDQTAAQNYLASDGTTVVWNGTANSAYKNNITAIGRDDASGLYQKQSKSVNVTAFLTISNGNTVAASNALNSSTFAANKSFDAISDNGLTTSYEIAYTTNSFSSNVPFFAMNRIWKVQESGTVGTVTLSIASTSATHLLVFPAGTSSFASGATEIALTSDGNGNMTATVDLTNGQLFTFGRNLAAPGGVTNKLRIWSKADVGTNTTTNGAVVNSWKNDVVGNLVALSSFPGHTASATYLANGSNYNPAVRMPTGAGLAQLDALTSTADGNGFTLFLKSKAGAGSTPGTGYAIQATVGTATLSAAGSIAGETGSYLQTATTAAPAYWDRQLSLVGSNLLNPQNDHILGYSYTTNTAGAYPYYVNGKSVAVASWTPYSFPGLNFHLNVDTDGGAEKTGFDYQEVIAFEQKLTTAEILKVESYLSTKYGMTLDQSTAQNYVATDGTVFWNATSNSAYANDITAIGRDDAQGLNQKQSKSVNATGLVTISNGTTVAASNALNSTNFSVDKSFDVFGDNGLSTYYSTVYTPSTFTSSSIFYTMARIWKVQETGTVGTVTISIPMSAERLLVYPAGTSSFGSGATEIALASDGLGNMTATLNLTNGQLFTFGKSIITPGGVISPVLWTKADAGISASEGGAVSNWLDQSSYNYNLAQSTGTNMPTYYGTTANKLLNFNPTVSFTSDDVVRNANSILASNSPFSFMGTVVDENTNTGYQLVFDANTSVDNFGFYKNGASSTNNGWVNYRAGRNEVGGHANSYSSTGGSHAYYNGTNFTYDASSVSIQPQIFGLNSINTTNVSPLNTFFDGYKTTVTPVYGGTQANYFGALSLGAEASGGEGFTGRIPEFMAFNYQLTDAETQRVNSYLAIKYGVTLGQGGSLANINNNAANYNYLATNGAVVWDATANSSYKYNITGIARDDVEGLYQKQSKSANATGLLTISNGTGVAATNAANTSTFAADRSYEMIGDNGLSTYYTSAYTPSTFTTPANFFAMARIWKVQETGTVGTVTISIPVGAERLLVYPAGTSSFSSGATEIVLTQDTVGNMTATLNLTNGQFFTFGKTIFTPGGVTPPVLWNKADAGIATTEAGSVSSWLDQSSYSYNLAQSTITNRPTYYSTTSDKLVNFNPAVSFSANDVVHNATSVFASNSPFSFMGTVVDENSDIGYHLIFDANSSADNFGFYKNGAGTTNNGWVNYRGGRNEVGGHANSFSASGGSHAYYNGTNFTSDAATVNIQPQIFGINSVNTTNASALNTFFDGYKSTVTPTYGGTQASYFGDISLGAEASGLEGFNGRIPEFMAFNYQLSDQETQRVNSYLAVKYGVTLGQGGSLASINNNSGNYNYLATNATVVWDATANSSYKYNITGIARDDVEGLYQKQSKSANATGLLTISNGTSVAATNAANTSTFAADRSYEMIGDNGLSTLYSTAYTPSTFTPIAPFFAMARIWKVQETGTVGAVTISIPLGAERLLVYPAGTSSFGSGATEIALTQDASGNMIATLNLTNGQLFTFGKTLSAPGGVAAPVLWSRSDAGISASNAGGISTWLDYSGYGYNLTQSTATNMPTYYSSTSDKLVNYNPSVSFSTNDVVLNANRIFASTSGFSFLGTVVDENTNTGYHLVFDSNTSPDNFGFYKYGAGVSNNGWVNYRAGNNFVGGQANSFSATGGSNGYYNGSNFTNNASTVNIQPQIFALNSINTTNTSPLNTFFDGYKTTVTPTNGGTQANYFGALSLGAEASVAEPFNGRIPEFIAYNYQLTDVETQRVNSYLAVKYGVTLGQGGSLANLNNNAANYNYLSTDGTVIWNATANSTYKYNILGIGRDDTEALNQKQSKSANATGLITLSNGSSVAASNATNASTFAADKSYEMIGDNGLSTNFTTVYTPSSFTSVAPFFMMARIWKVQETGTVGTVTVSVPGASEHLLVFPAGTSTFTSGATEIPLSSDGNGNMVATVNLTNGQLFTFGRVIAAPGGVTDNLKVWARADVGTNTTTNGATVTTWHNYIQGDLSSLSSFSNHNASATYLTAGSNYNPAVRMPQGAGLAELNAFSSSVTNSGTGLSVYLKFKAGAGTSPNVGYNVQAMISDGTLSSVATNAGQMGSYIQTATSAGPFYWDRELSYVGANSFNPSEDQILGFLYTTNTQGNYPYKVNGKSLSVGNYTPFNVTGTNFHVNTDTDGGTERGGHDYQEVIGYEQKLSAGDQQKVETYLAIKYGITLDQTTPQNYVATNGTVIWNGAANSTYKNNIAGIGRDDVELLHQKQSQSVNATSAYLITMGIDNQIAAGNLSNSGAFATNLSYLVWGDNNLTGLTSPSGCAPQTIDKQLSRSWKVVETGTVESTQVSVDLSGSTFVSDVYMMVSSDAGFTNSVAVPMSNGGSGTIYVTDYDFNGTNFVTFVGNTVVVQNVCTGNKTLNWITYSPSFDWWGWGTKAKNYTVGDQQFQVSISDPGNTVLLNTWYPVSVGNNLYIPRYDNNSTASSKVTTKIVLKDAAGSSAKPSMGADFTIYGVDVNWGRDVLNVYGKINGQVVNPKLSLNKNSWVNITSPTQAKGGTYYAGVSSYGQLYVDFDSAIDEIYVEMNRENVYTFKTWNDLFIGHVNFTCSQPLPETPLNDNVYIFDEVSPKTSITNEEFKYKFTILNNSCNTQSVNFNKVLPSGLTWVDNTLASALSIGSTNAYGATTTLTLGSISVPTGTSYFYASAVAASAGTYAAQGSYTVNGHTYLTDEPSIAGTTNPTPITITSKPTANLTIVKSVNHSTMSQNGVVRYTYTITNNESSSVSTFFEDALVGGQGTFVAASLSGSLGAAQVSDYANIPVITIRDLTIAANGTLVLTIDANVNATDGGSVISNQATITQNANASYRQSKVQSNAVTVTVSNSAPTVTTTAITGITNIAAVSGGEVTSDGGDAVTERGVCWSTSTNPTTALSTKTSNGSGTGTFTSNITGLSPSTTYYVKAYATNALGTTYGDAASFTTFATADFQTYNITADQTFTTATLAWTNGSKTSRVVFMKEGAGAITNPANSTSYTASTNWASRGTQLGASGYYCIYNGTGTSADVTDLYPGRLYTLQAYEYSGAAGSENYLTTVTGANNPVTFIPWPSTTFTNSPGVSTSEPWNTTTCWDHGVVPNSALHEAVLVYVDGNCVVTTSAETANLTILAAHSGITPKLTINPAKSMNVLGGSLSGALINNGSASALVVKASSSAANGSLIYTNGTPSGTVEMYSKAFTDTKKHWQFFGIPVASTLVGNTFGTSAIVRKYDESNIDPAGTNIGLWDLQSSGATMVPFWGYEVVQPAATTYTFSGVLNHDSYTIQLPYTVGADWAGQNIVSNPYPAAIDIKELIFGSETESSVYQYNTGSLKEWQDNLAVQTPGTQPGTYIVSTKQTAGILQIPRRIPSMQGFLVNALSNSSNATLEIPYSAVRMPNVESQRAPRSVAAETTVATQIDLVSAHSSDQLWLISEPTCTRNFDKGWDGYKFIAPASIAQIYASEVDGDYQIDVLNDVNDTYISLQAGVDTNFKLVFTHQNLGLKYNQLFLLDLLTNQTTDITLSGAEVSFIAQPTPSQTKRFKILTSRASATIDDAYNNADLKVFCSKGKIVIQNMSSDGGSVDIYNVSGVQLSTKQFGAYERVELLDVITGVYLVKAKTQNCDTKQKVIVP